MAARPTLVWVSNANSERVSTLEHRAEPVSDKETWDGYLSGLTISDESIASQEYWFRQDPIAAIEPGSVFELGCAASSFLACAARRGWTVAGVDYVKSGLDVIEEYLDGEGIEHGPFYDADIFELDWGELAERFDLIASFGFLEHFTNADVIVASAAKALRPGGLMLAQIPNLFSVNAKLMERYDPELWSQHVPYDNGDIDDMHRSAGLELVMGARYDLGFDQYMLTPWPKIGEKLPLPAYKLMRYTVSYLVEPAVKLLPKRGHRSYCSSVVGIYRKPVA